MATVLRWGFAVLVGCAVFAVLAATSGAGARCYSLLGFEVSCEPALAIAAGAVAAVVVGVALWRTSPRRLT
jgi:hypothetical protein